MTAQLNETTSALSSGTNENSAFEKELNPQRLERLESPELQNAFIESDAGDGTRSDDQHLHGTKLLISLLSLFLCLFLVGLDQTIVSTLLTVVADKFNGFDKVGWMTSGFMLSMTVFVATWGKLSIIFGRKATILLAIAIFEAGSLICALAGSMDVLIGGRVLAGIGGGGLQSLVIIIMSEVAGMEKRSVVIAGFSVTFILASVVGPLIGGAFTTNVTWRWCFYINLPIGGVAGLVFFWVFNPPKVKGNLKEKAKMIDYFGTFLLIVGLVVFLLALTFGAGDNFKWNSAAVICCFVIGGVILILFGIWNFRFSKNPIISLEVAKVPQINGAALLGFGNFGCFMATLLYLAIYFQVIKEKDALHSGLHLLPVIISTVVASLLSGIIMQKTKLVKPFCILGGILSPVGAGLLSLLEVNSSLSKQIGLLIINGVSGGLLMNTSMLSSQLSAPKTPGGTILTNTYVNFTKSLGGCIGGNLAVAVYSASFQNYYASALSKIKDPRVASELKSINSNILVASTEIISKLSQGSKAFVKEQVMKAIHNVFYMEIGFGCLALIGTIFTTNKRLPEKTVSGITEEDKEEYTNR